uniref:Carbohydrate kinase PfkB domain-containing protein n=1 Tax=Glossina brevipalpis TaxID=37001 RepID=A0A1A9WN01_9MUSC
MTSRLATNLFIQYSKIFASQINARCYSKLFDIHPKIQNAINKGEPIVALESTIISHGMPFPHNVNTALEVENVVSSTGAIPATIAIIDGSIKVGLNKDDLIKLSKADDTVIKCSRRDMAYVVAKRQTGGTTVAATIRAACMVGIKVFATGGIGGVHRNGHMTMDVSADLVELGRTPIAVVSSGVKSILDIPRTLEYLETQGVCVTTYGNAERRFPDFYTQDSGIKVPYNLRDAQEAATLINTLNKLQINSGILIGVPIPEQYAADKEQLRAAIEQAYKEAELKGVIGKDVTPFVLAAIARITEGNSLQANMALIKNNAFVAAQIACELSKIEKRPVLESVEKEESMRNDQGKPLIIGASMLDVSQTIIEDKPLALDGGTYHTKVTVSGGGVGRNIAEAILKLHGQANLISTVGNDHMGESLMRLIPKQLHDGILISQEESTAMCAILFDKGGDCKICMANMQIHGQITPEIITQNENKFKTTPLVIMDGNLSKESMESILQLSLKYKRPVFFEPTDKWKAVKPFNLDYNLTKQVRFISPNIFELETIVEAMCLEDVVGNTDKNLNILSYCKILTESINSHFDCIAVTLGCRGVILSLRADNFEVPLFDPGCSTYLVPKTNKHSIRLYEAPSVKNVINVSGAGDSWSSGFITGLLRGLSVQRSVALGFLAATKALQHDSAVPQKYFENPTEEQRLLQKSFETLHFQDI